MSRPFRPARPCTRTSIRPVTRTRLRVLAAVLVVVSTSACAGGGTDPDPAPQLSPDFQLPPAQHVHAVAIDPDRPEAVLMATHDGLFVVTTEGHERVGPVIDLMGFDVVGAGHYVASGHPGAEVDMPDPVGLIESTDGGRTWTGRSRAGESDFHALVGWDTGALAVGHGLERTDDLTTWSSMDTAADVFDVSTPDGVEVLVTNEGGPQRSQDGGLTWSALAAAPVLQFVEHRSPGAAVGVTPEGVVHVTEDGGLSWVELGDLGTAPLALAVGADPRGPTILVLTEAGLFEHGEGDEGFVPWG